MTKITEYEWSDTDVKLFCHSEDGSEITLVHSGVRDIFVDFNQDDAAVMAEHFGLLDVIYIDNNTSKDITIKLKHGENKYKTAFLAAKALINSIAAADVTDEMCEKYSKYLEAIKELSDE